MEYMFLRGQLADMRKALLNEGLINEQFVMMEDLEDYRRNNIVERCIALYFDHCSSFIDQVDRILMKDRLDFEAMHIILAKLKKESIIVGANKVAIKTDDMKKCKPQGSIPRLKEALEDIKAALQTLKVRLNPYFHLLRQVGPLDGAERPIKDGITT